MRACRDSFPSNAENLLDKIKHMFYNVSIPAKYNVDEEDGIMSHIEMFWGSVKKEETAILATAAGGSVTMRTVSPVYHEDAILMFTSPASQKYAQLKENASCCIMVGGCFLEAKAEFLGHTMTDENAALRAVYDAKQPGAFDEGLEFGGRESEFILLKPVQLKGWDFTSGEHPAPFAHTF